MPGKKTTDFLSLFLFVMLKKMRYLSETALCVKVHQNEIPTQTYIQNKGLRTGPIE